MTPQLPTISPQKFIELWTDAGFNESQGAQSFFNDLCDLIGHPKPRDVRDPESFTFEKAVPGGFADAYYEGRFVWEFKGRARQLNDAVTQAVGYARHLKNPPLIVASSFETIRIETNFQGMELVQHNIAVSELDQPDKLRLLRHVFFNPSALRPERGVTDVTQDTARLFSRIVADMEGDTADPELLARHLNQIIFCLYAEDAGLLPEGIFASILRSNRQRPDLSNRAISDLFRQMSEGGLFGTQEIAHFNGDLFSAGASVELSSNAMQRLGEAVEANWRSIEPSIFGTLFERALDASKRAQTGAHYTGAEDIELVVEPVVMSPLRQEWDVVRREVEELLSESGFAGFLDFQDVVAGASTAQSCQSRNPVNPASDDASEAAWARLESFRQRLASVTVLDPACGSGNFLYIALRSLLDLEREVIDFAAAQGWTGLTPAVQPNQMLGLEINHYAAELARTALWIGYIQWHQANGFPYTQRPILTPLDTIRQTDAILDLTDPENPAEPDWPAAEFIVGNPPFLGSQLIRGSLPESHTDLIFRLFGKRIPNYSDYCCYWFEKARQMVEDNRSKRVGLLATQGIRGGANRRVLERIKETGDIFAAHSERPWMLEGAAVRVSIVCFDNGAQVEKELDGQNVTAINANLTAGVDLTQARRLPENAGRSFIGDMKKGKFEIDAETASEMLNALGNPNGRPNSDVVRPWVNALDITRHPRDMWIIDFDANISEHDAAQYEMPFEYVKEHVKPFRDSVRNSLERRRWWVHGRTAPDFRQAVSRLDRYIATPRVAKHRIFVFLRSCILPDGAIVAIASDDDYDLGVLQSRFHEVWALNLGTQLESRPRYSHTATFETFPFPHPTDEQRQAIALAAAELNRLRENDTRTLTNLYNARPTWLDNAHAKLDAAVAAAYGWPADLGDAEILERLLALNLERADG